MEVEEEKDDDSFFDSDDEEDVVDNDDDVLSFRHATEESVGEAMKGRGRFVLKPLKVESGGVKEMTTLFVVTFKRITRRRGTSTLENVAIVYHGTDGR